MPVFEVEVTRTSYNVLVIQAETADQAETIAASEVHNFDGDTDEVSTSVLNELDADTALKKVDEVITSG